MIKYNLLIKKNRLLIEITQMNFIDIISSKNRKKLHTHDYKYKKTKLICGDRSQKMNDSKWKEIVCVDQKIPYFIWGV